MFMQVNSRLVQRPPKVLTLLSRWALRVPSAAEHLAVVHTSSRQTGLNVFSCRQMKAGLAGGVHSSVRTHALIRQWSSAHTHSFAAGGPLRCSQGCSNVDPRVTPVPHFVFLLSPVLRKP